jgi:hypothetical protein
VRKRDQRQFRIQADALIESLGAKPVDEWYPWRLKTKAGPLSLRVDEEVASVIGTVFTRFDSPPDAEELVDCNPYSGKWNHHYFDGWTVESALRDLSHQLRKVTC